VTVRVLSREELPGLVGQSLGASSWRPIDQKRVHDFGVVTEDEQWVHLDVERATRELGGTIAHGFLSIAMMSAMIAEIWRVDGATRLINYGFNRLRFLAPVPTGASIRLSETVAGVEPKGSNLLLTCDAAIELLGSEKPAVMAQWLVLVCFD
jgi:acyl dehydratase